MLSKHIQRSRTAILSKMCRLGAAWALPALLPGIDLHDPTRACQLRRAVGATGGLSETLTAVRRRLNQQAAS